MFLLTSGMSDLYVPLSSVPLCVFCLPLVFVSSACHWCLCLLPATGVCVFCLPLVFVSSAFHCWLFGLPLLFLLPSTVGCLPLFLLPSTVGCLAFHCCFFCLPLLVVWPSTVVYFLAHCCLFPLSSLSTHHHFPHNATTVTQSRNVSTCTVVTRPHIQKSHKHVDLWLLGNVVPHYSRTAGRSSSASRAEGPGSNPACNEIFFRSSHSSDLKIGASVATLPGAWRYGVSAETGRPGVKILWSGEVESLICNFYLSVAARKIVWADPSLRYTSMLLGR